MIKVLANFISGENSLPELQTAAFSLSFHKAFPLHSCRKRKISGISSSFY